jgi:hypothetical protein
MRVGDLLKRLVVGSIALTSVARVSQAQARGFPRFFDPSYSYGTRIGLDVSDGAELGEGAWALGASHLFFVGNCPRVAISGAGGTWNPRGDAPSGKLNLGASASYLLNACPRPTSQPNPTFRLVAGAGLTRAVDRTIANLPLAAEVGYLIEIAAARVEPWAATRVHYLESPTTAGKSTWRIGVSTGLNVGLAGSAGLRFAADFGTGGGVGFGGGASIWLE